jgi:hypothetical protein
VQEVLVIEDVEKGLPSRRLERAILRTVDAV